MGMEAMKICWDQVEREGKKNVDGLGEEVVRMSWNVMGMGF